MGHSLSSVVERLVALKPILLAKFGVSSVAIFGSYAREESRADSDLDLLLDFSRTPTLFDLARLDQFLESELGLRVDTVPRDSQNPRYAPYIEPDLLAL